MSFTSSEHATSYIKALLRPLVKWCLKYGLRSAKVEELVREAFVDEAATEIRKAAGAFSISKVSIITGLHRTEVSRLLSEEGEDDGQHDLLTRIIGLWSSSKRYRAKDGTTRELTHEGLSSEFARLVAEVSKEVTHYPILFELERIGAIEYHENKVRLVTREYTPSKDLDYGLSLLSLDVADLTSAIEANLSETNKTPSLHLRTAFDNIDPARLDEIRRWIMKRGAQFQNEVRDYLASVDRDTTSESSAENTDRARVAVTAFSYAEPIQAIKPIPPRKRGRKKASQNEK